MLVSMDVRADNRTAQCQPDCFEAYRARVQLSPDDIQQPSVASRWIVCPDPGPTELAARYRTGADDHLLQLPVNRV